MDALPESDLARDPNLSPPERAELKNDYYELMLTLARTAGYSISSMPLDIRRQKSEAGLHILEQISKADRDSKAFHQTRSDLLRALGDTAGANGELHLAEGLQPSTASDFFFVGLNQFRAGDLNNASFSFDRALRLQPNHFEAQCFRARVSLDLGRTKEARIALTACIAQKPGSAWAYLLRGLALIDERSFDEALNDFATAAQLDQGNAVQYTAAAYRGRLWLRQENFEKAVAEFRSASKLGSSESQAHLQLAKAYEGLRRFADADREMDEAMRLRPDLALIPRQHGRMRSERREQEAALDDFRAAIKLASASGKDPELADDYMRCGAIRHTQKRFAEAIAEFDSALRTRPDDARANHLRGESLLALERFEEAARALDRSLELQPGFGPALRARGQTRVQLADYVGAVEDYSQAAALERDASILMHRGWAYFFCDAFRMAEHDFEEAIRLDKHPGDARIGRGLSRVMLGAYKPALADAHDVLEREPPKSTEMMYNLACIFTLALNHVHADAKEKTRESLEADCRKQAMVLLQKALDLLPPDKQLDYWQKKMYPDSALDSIRSLAEFVNLDEDLKAKKHRSGGIIKK